jgi:hypothetical protein
MDIKIGSYLAERVRFAPSHVVEKKDLREFTFLTIR